MSRNIDSTLAAGLANANIQPIILAALTFASGVVYVWSGVGDLVWGGNTYQGVGALGSISAISEGSSVQADGMTLTLSGIPIPGLNLPYLADPTPPSGVTPPVTVPSGQQIAWVLPTTPTSSGIQTQTNCSSIYIGTLEASGAATDNGGTVLLSGSCSLTAFPSPSPYAAWSGFEPPSLPSGSVINSIYPVALISGTVDAAFHEFAVTVGGTTADTQIMSGAPFSGQFDLSDLGDTDAIISSTQVTYTISQSLSGGGRSDQATITGVALAVYYTPGQPSLITETLDDIELGAPAKVYLGLMQDGAILGTPYLAFLGTMDQPGLKIGPDTMTISLSLENKLTNLQRANQRRYTSADQRQIYPDDTAFSWVEQENDIAERWG